MPNYTTRPATIDDAPVIAEYNRAMARETEHRELDPARLLAGVEAVFAQPGHGRYLVATDASGAVVGCLMITYEWSDWRNGCFWWVQSVYVHPDHRRRGVFRLLYRSVRELGEAEGGVCGYRLYVERENRSAQQTYRSLGMAGTPYLVFESETPDRSGAG
ncbi:MAG: GNAT family N-acetyltransferase [Planctomycetota bacterium]